MPTLWTSLMPHAPLPTAAASYVPRVNSASEEIVKWLLADRSPVLLGGPTGVGKSTELNHAAQLLEPHRLVCLLPLDRWENMRRLSAEQMLRHIARRVALVATDQQGLLLSPDLKRLLDREGHGTSAPEFARLVLTEVSRLSRKGKVTLLFDGLEKVPEGSTSTKLFDALASLPEEVQLVAVIPYQAAFGPRAETILRPGERFVSARALEVAGDPGRAGRAFLHDLLRSRVDEDVVARGHSEVVEEAAELSGGIPRTFLQLMADASTYAQHHQAAWPDPNDLRLAVWDQVDTFRRLLLPGDANAARSALGTDGRELNLGRKVRMMSHGILLERLREHTPILEMHPLARLAIDQGEAHA